MMVKELLILYSILFFFSCNVSQKKKIETNTLINIEVNDLDDRKLFVEKSNRINANIEKYFKPVRYIQLESDSNMLIGEMDRIVLRDNRIYILDQWVTSSVFVFNGDGRFVNRISHRGQGAEEYIDMRDMFYDDYDNTINIVANAGSRDRFKIMSYDRNGGELVKQRFIDLSIHQVVRIGDGRYVFHSKNASNRPDITTNVSVYSKTMQRLYDGLPIRTGWVDRMSSSNRSLYRDKDNNVYCAPDRSTDLYKVTTDSLQHCYHYDFGKYNFPEDLKTPEVMEKMGRAHQLNDYVCDLNDFYKGENYVISAILFKGQYRFVIYNEEKQSVNSFLSPAPSFNGFSNNCIVLSTPGDTYPHLFKNPSIVGEERTEELKKYFKYPFGEEDNPVLEIYEFK